MPNHFTSPRLSSTMALSRLSIIIISSIIYLFHHFEFAIAAGVSTSPYYLVDDGIAINCGSSGNSTALDGRKWIGDFTTQGKSTNSRAVHHQYLSADPVPYMTARISRSQFTYTFHVSPGQKFIRLHFYPSTYLGFVGSKAFFSVKAGPYTLLNNFSTSLTADASGVKYFAKEFCLNIDDNQALNITFTPSPSTSSEDLYAFVNGIEIVSMPTGLYYTRDDDFGALIVGSKYRFYIDNITALEMIHRLNVGGRSILSVEDLGMFRAWSEDWKYLLQSGVSSIRTSMEIKYGGTPTHVAPLEVYQTACSLGPISLENKMYHLTWKLPVNLGFTYLVRLHFCELEPGITEAGQREFSIFINNNMAETSADLIKWGGGNGVALYRDYVVNMKGDRLDDKRDIIIALKPKPNSKSGNILSNPILNGLEIFKLSNHQNNLAGPNPMPIEYASTLWTPNLMKLYLAFGIGNVFATSVTVILTLLSIIVYQLNRWGANSCENNTFSSNEEELCRRFSFVDIQMATNNFDDTFVIGNGGFGKVYKGLIDRGSKTVAIKRLKLESKQGAPEFWMEIETLSTFQHTHLVSLIGYCDEGREMILVYEYMAYGTLADHLYKIHKKGNGSGNNPLDWEQRLKICIGAARGLDYLHTGRGARHGLIHRDVKSSNILLDINWIAKISDFGLSKMEAANLSRTHISTAVKGTFGYLDPEYFMTRRLTSKSDVYAFGVVLLEVLCGRPAVDTNIAEEQHSLALWAQSCLKDGRLDQIIDTNVKNQISTHCLKEYAEISMKCLCNHSNQRPTMAEVVAGLEFALEQQWSVYSDREAEDVNNEQNSKRSPTREKNISKVDENIAVGEAKGTELPRMKTRGPSWGWRWDSIWRRTRPSKVTNYPMPDILCRRFSFTNIQDATHNFTTKIGIGNFEPVYFGYIDDIRMNVAIQNRRARTTDDAFFNEVRIHSQLRHINLVSLVGYCNDGGLFLVYEYYHGNRNLWTLYDHLHGNGVRPISWKQRLQICVGIARGLNYLHTGTENKIIHRGVMPHNILLDDKWVPKFSGFEYSMLFPTSEFSTYCTSRIAGTYGYMAPEYMMTGRLSEKSDVFSFGVVLFEMLSGRKAVAPELMEEEWDLSIWAPRIVASGRVDQIIDPVLMCQMSPDCLSMFVETANKCLLSNGSERPSMLHVLRSLELAQELQESFDAPAEASDGESLITNLGDPLHNNSEASVGGVLDDSTEWSLPR